ncbi:PulJ/GspJ family protein [Oceanobacillus piezotolerans]|nr:prepilin-type N-terminal cleavage/methylation domain-containing protein [Oceanobacillus piezotolerans]
MHFKNERGLTLVELLAAIVLTSIIGVIGYSVLFNGIATYDRVKAETELRDEADLIMASMINELYTLKLSEIKVKNLPEAGTDNHYLVIKADEEENKEIGFIDGMVIINDNEVSLHNEIQIANGTKIEEIEEGHYRITLVLEKKDSNQKIETISEIGIINDKKPGGEGNELPEE